MMKKSITIIILLCLLICGITYFFIFDNKSIEKEDNKNNVFIENIIREYEIENLRDIIYSNEEFFVKYANTIKDNNGLGNYKKEVFNIFELIVDNVEFLDMEYFINCLSKLKIVEKEDLLLEGSAGTYVPYSIEIDINCDNIADTIYHELVHFVNDSIKNDENAYDIKYLCNNNFYTEIEYLELENKNDCSDISGIEKGYYGLISEGGTELISAQYFTNNYIDTYYLFVQIYEMLNIMLGYENVSEIFYGTIDSLELYKILVIENDVSLKEFEEFCNHLYKISDQGTMYDMINFIDLSIDIYEKIHNKSWYSDQKFSYIIYVLLNFNENNNISDSKYFLELKNNKTIYEKVNNNIEDIIKTFDETNVFYIINLFVSNKHNENYIFSHINTLNEYFINFNYDFKNNKIISYKLIK